EEVCGSHEPLPGSRAPRLAERRDRPATHSCDDTPTPRARAAQATGSTTRHGRSSSRTRRRRRADRGGSSPMSTSPPARARLRTVGSVAALTLAFGAVAAPASSEPVTGSEDDRLVVHYPLNETSGSVVTDASGNDRHAEGVDNTRGTARWEPGRGPYPPGGTGTTPAGKPPGALTSGREQRRDALRAHMQH